MEYNIITYILGGILVISLPIMMYKLLSSTMKYSKDPDLH